MKIAKFRWKNSLIAGLTALSFASTAALAVSGTNQPPPGEHASAAKAETRALLDKRRQKLDKQARLAQLDILTAVSALEDKDSRSAYQYLEKASGMLDVLLARDPALKLAPIDVHSTLYDLKSPLATVKVAEQAAEDALDKGQVQKARELLKPLASEVRITTDYLPLDTYPDAIRRASRQIHDKQMDLARDTLQAALDSIVRDDEAVPLAPVKAQANVLAAEQLIKADKTRNKDEAVKLLNAADQHLAYGTALGYGDFSDLHAQIDSVRQKIGAGRSDQGMFASLRRYFDAL